MQGTPYQDAVREAAAALSQGEKANWELARLTYETTNTQTDRSKTSMARWCRDIREESHRQFSEVTGHKYKAMWSKFGTLYESTRLSWTDGWQEITGDHNFGKRVSPEKITADSETWQPETKQAAVKALLADPEVAKAVVADDDTNLAISQARQEHDKEAHDVGEIKDPQRRQARHSTEQTEGLYELVRFRNWVLRISENARQWEWTEDLQAEWVDAIEGLRAALDLAETAPDFDVQLEEMTG